MSQMPTSAPGPRVNLRGAVDLSGLRRTDPRPPTGGDAGADAGAETGGAFTSVVADVTDATFGDVVEQSMTVPVVVDLWATWCQPCKQLSPVLEKLAAEHAGAFLLAKVDVDANPQISQAFGVQSIPTVVAIVKGQPVPLFQGAYPEPQVRQVLSELLKVASANGVTGRLALSDDADADAQDAPDEVEEPLPPLHQEAYEAIERDDMDAAADAYRRALAENPADEMARTGLAQVELLRRTAGADLAGARAAAGDPADVDRQLLAADLEVLAGEIEAGFARLVDAVRATSGDERDRARARLVELFEIVGGDDPRVVAARRALASALF